MLKITPLLTIFLVCVLINSCSDSDAVKTDATNFYPLQINKSWIYDVSEEIHSASTNGPVMKTYQEKDEVVNAIVNASGSTIYTISRSQRLSQSASWQITKTLFVERFPEKFLTTIDNQIYVSLIIPVDPSAKWNVNAYNTLDAVSTNYSNIGLSSDILGTPVSNTITVIEDAEDNVLRLVNKKTIYGYTVGPIYEDNTDFEYCQNSDCIGQQKVESGSRKIRKLVM